MIDGHVASSSVPSGSSGSSGSSEPRQNERRQWSAPEPARCGAPPGARPHRRAGVVKVVAVTGILVVAGVTVYAERSILFTAGTQLGHLNWGWLLLGIACEFVSMLAFALLQRRMMLAAGASRLPLVAFLATAYKANAIYLGVPVFGSGMATSYACRQFQKQGVTPAAIGLALAVAGIFSTVAFTLVVALGALLSGNAVSAALGVIGVVGLLTGVVVFLASLHWPRSRATLERALASVLHLVGRVGRRPIDDPRQSVAAAFDRVRSLRLRPPVVVAASTYALANWLSDVLCLACAILAVGPHLPWDRLLLVWAAGAGAGGLTPTPAGLGVVDLVLIAALVGTGVGLPTATAAVVIYRIIAFKLLVTLGWVVYGSLQRRRMTVSPLTATTS
jgi:putative heme transporter